MAVIASVIGSVLPSKLQVVPEHLDEQNLAFLGKLVKLLLRLGVVHSWASIILMKIQAKLIAHQTTKQEQAPRRTSLLVATDSK